MLVVLLGTAVVFAELLGVAVVLVVGASVELFATLVVLVELF